jgi:hypothetical protein
VLQTSNTDDDHVLDVVRVPMDALLQVPHVY